MTLQEFLAKHAITATARRRKSNPNMDQDDWHASARHWTVTLKREGLTLAVPFSQGSAHQKPPTAADVLDCLASDAAGVENAHCFHEWATEYGYDTDSRKAERSYHACKEQSEKLKEFLGSESYSALLWETERD